MGEILRAISPELYLIQMDKMVPKTRGYYGPNMKLQGIRFWYPTLLSIGAYPLKDSIFTEMPLETYIAGKQ